MSTYLWSLFARTRTRLSSSLHYQSFQHRSLSVKRLEEKKIERLSTLRTTVTSNYRLNNGSIDWQSVRKELESRGLFFRTNFEFALLSAFGGSPQELDHCTAGESADSEPFRMDQPLFQSIANYVQQSPAVNSNKIAAIRYCRFLSLTPEFLSKAQIEFIRQVADTILADNIQVPQIIVDVISALAHSSAANCRHTLTIYEKYLTGDFKLKLDVLQTVFEALLRYELSAELHQFVLQHGELLKLDFDLTGKVLRHLAKKKTFEGKPDKVLDILKFLSSSFASVDQKFQNTLVERILVRKLGYSNVSSPKISTNGVCSCCGSQLTGITKEEFEQLKSNFRTIIFDKNDQYLINNLAEYEVQLFEFEDRIKGKSPFGESKPKFDLVIDSLNISYRKASTIVQDSTGLRNYTRVFKVKDLDQQIVRLLVGNRIFERFERSLLIGREHMKVWFGLNRLLRQNANRVEHVYLLNKTRDDNFILYAAIQHPSTKILSGDYFRDHREKFTEWYLKAGGTSGGGTTTTSKPNLPRIFSRWLRSRQITISDDHQFVFPNEFDMKIHIQTTSSSEAAHSSTLPTLHIPVVTLQDPYSNDDHHYSWLCVRP